MDDVYLDFQKAFDNVLHQRLLLKLKDHGIGNDVINWTEFFLYIYIYINDSEDDISSKVLKFADDSKLFRKVTSDTDKQSLQNDLETEMMKNIKWGMLY